MSYKLNVFTGSLDLVGANGGLGAVTSVSNSDGTLTVTPTTGSVVASLALAHPNTWTGEQTFNTPIDMAGTNPIYFGNDTLASLVASANTTADIEVVTNTSSATATGTFTVTTAGGNIIYTFTGAGTFTPLFTGNVNYLVVAGGGGAGGATGGGGGAGGFLTGILSLTSGAPQTVTIGAGGAFGVNGQGANGNNSVFSSITAIGGGGGGWANVSNGSTGGSGGGAGWNNRTGGAGTAGQGNAGGNSNNNANDVCGGGGGAGAAGGASVGSVAGNGGAGLSSSISGVSIFYAGGGGGGTFSGTPGTGGAGGGGNTTVNGTANTGGGGGGSTANLNNGGSGGSGIVIVSFAASMSSETARFTTGGNFLVGTTSTALSGAGNIEASGVIKSDIALNSPAISNLTSNGIVTTSGGIGTLSVTGTTGSGNVVLATSPTLVTPALGTPASGVATNLTGTAAGLTAGTVTTNANLTGAVTSVGNATSSTITAPTIATSLTASYATPSTSAVFNASKQLVSGSGPIPQIVASGNLLAQAATVSSVTTYTTPNDSTVHSFRAGAYAVVTAISAGTITLSVNFTDENAASRTVTYFGMGLTTAAISTTGFTAFAPANIRCSPNTAITLVATFAGVSITYDVGGTIESLY